MTKPILYGVKLSPPVRACLLTAAAIDLDIEFRDTNLWDKAHLTPEYLEKNPQHTVPTLADEGKFIWDSHAIIAYLVGKYAKDDALYPKDLYKRALVDQRLYFESGIVFQKLRETVVLIIRERKISYIPQHLIDAFNDAYDFLEKFLENDKFMVGNSITIADFSMISSISSIGGLVHLSPDKHPNILAWIKRMEALPFYDEANGKGAKDIIKLLQKSMDELKAQNI